jgi:hypothetical protein
MDRSPALVSPTADLNRTETQTIRGRAPKAGDISSVYGKIKSSQTT